MERAVKKGKGSRLGTVVENKLIRCPVCSKQVPMAVINVHLDSSCKMQQTSPQPLRNSIKPSQSDRVAEAPQNLGMQALPVREVEDDRQDGKRKLGPAVHASGQEKRQKTAEDNCGPRSCEENRPSAPKLPQIEKTAGDPQGKPQVELLSCTKTNAEMAAGDGDCRTDLPSKEIAKCSINDIAPSVFQQMKSAANHKLPGQFLYEDFISEEEERQLIEQIDVCEPSWHLSTFNGPHRGKAWGVCMNLQRRTVMPPKHAMPKFLTDLAERMRERKPLRDFYPSEANANDYYPDKGMYLGPHVDDRQLSTDAIVTLSLVDAAVMTFQKERLGKAAPKIRVLLPPRSLQALTGDSRYSYTHAIAQEDFQGSRRLSVTFRQSPLKK